MLFVIFKFNTNLNINVKCFGHRVAMYFHAPRGIVLWPLFVHCKILLEYKKNCIRHELQTKTSIKSSPVQT